MTTILSQPRNEFLMHNHSPQKVRKKPNNRLLNRGFFTGSRHMRWRFDVLNPLSQNDMTIQMTSFFLFLFFLFRILVYPKILAHVGGGNVQFDLLRCDSQDGPNFDNFFWAPSGGSNSVDTCSREFIQSLWLQVVHHILA